MRDEFPLAVQRQIAARVANRCSRPDCRAFTSGPQEDHHRSVNVGVAAHITAASPGGPRYDATLTPEQRKSAENGAWLCQTHAKLVDNDEAKYSVAVLRAWKTLAEAEACDQVGKSQPPLDDNGGPEPPYTINNVENIPWLNMPIPAIDTDSQIQTLRDKGYYIGGGAVSSLGDYMRGGSEYILWKQPSTGKLYRLFAGMGIEPGPLDLIWLMRKL